MSEQGPLSPQHFKSFDELAAELERELDKKPNLPGRPDAPTLRELAAPGMRREILKDVREGSEIIESTSFFISDMIKDSLRVNQGVLEVDDIVKRIHAFARISILMPASYFVSAEALAEAYSTYFDMAVFDYDDVEIAFEDRVAIARAFLEEVEQAKADGRYFGRNRNEQREQGMSRREANAAVLDFVKKHGYEPNRAYGKFDDGKSSNVGHDPLNDWGKLQDHLKLVGEEEGHEEEKAEAPVEPVQFEEPVAEQQETPADRLQRLLEQVQQRMKERGVEPTVTEEDQDKLNMQRAREMLQNVEDKLINAGIVFPDAEDEKPMSRRAERIAAERIANDAAREAQSAALPVEIIQSSSGLIADCIRQSYQESGNVFSAEDVVARMHTVCQDALMMPSSDFSSVEELAEKYTRYFAIALPRGVAETVTSEDKLKIATAYMQEVEAAKTTGRYFGRNPLEIRNRFGSNKEAGVALEAFLAEHGLEPNNQAREDRKPSWNPLLDFYDVKRYVQAKSE